MTIDLSIRGLSDEGLNSALEAAYEALNAMSAELSVDQDPADSEEQRRIDALEEELERRGLHDSFAAPLTDGGRTRARTFTETLADRHASGIAASASVTAGALRCVKGASSTRDAMDALQRLSLAVREAQAWCQNVVQQGEKGGGEQEL